MSATAADDDAATPAAAPRRAPHSSGRATRAPAGGARGSSRGADRPTAADESGGGPASPQKQRKLQDQQRELQARLARTKKNLAEAEAAHSEASDALAESETAISSANRRLHELAAERSGVERQLADVRQRQRAATSRQGEQQQRLAGLLQALLVAGGGAGEALPGAPQELERDGALGFTGYLVSDRVHAIGELQDRRVELAALEQEAHGRQDELARIAADERRNRGQLVREQDARRRTLASLSRQIADQRRSVASLERDEQRLGNLIQQLARALAEPPRRAPPRSPGATGSAPAPVPAPSFEPPAGAGLGALRGKLRLPVAGEIVARFGSARRTEDGEAESGAPSWKGVFLRAASGAEVHAIAAGRVVFADWLRGFGNLMIIDHGEGFISVYGNNESLLHSAGERVAADEVIATVGSTGGSAESGLYFELRYGGRPFDPLAWAVAR